MEYDKGLHYWMTIWLTPLIVRPGLRLINHVFPTTCRLFMRLVRMGLLRDNSKNLPRFFGITRTCLRSRLTTWGVLVWFNTGLIRGRVARLSYLLGKSLCIRDRWFNKRLRRCWWPSDGPWASPIVLATKKDGSTQLRGLQTGQ